MDFKAIEEEYVSSGATYRELSARYNVPMHKLARFAALNGWVAKRKAFLSSPPPPSFPDISKLARSSAALETIIEAAFVSASQSGGAVDTKALKDLTSALKEAIAIKQNIYLLPVLTEQKKFELEVKKAPSVAVADEIRVTLENGADKYCV